MDRQAGIDFVTGSCSPNGSPLLLVWLFHAGMRITMVEKM